jgi:hypothetical protein
LQAAIPNKSLKITRAIIFIVKTCPKKLDYTEAIGLDEEDYDSKKPSGLVWQSPTKIILYINIPS